MQRTRYQLGGGELTIALEDRILDPQTAHHHGHRAPGPYVCLSIRDTGSGIPPEVQEHMFEPFFTTKEVGKGTGLGLSIVHGIVESHGGHIQILTEPGRGTEFEIYLPATDAEEPAQEDQPEVPGGTESLLLVEDDANVRDIMEKMLEEKGYTVLAAQDGCEGFNIYQTHAHIDLVVSDIVMPGIGGAEFCLKLADLDPDVRILLISGYNRAEQNLEAVPEGVIAGYLQKPFDLAPLARTIREILDRAPVPT